MADQTDLYERNCVLVIEDNATLAGALGQILERMRIAYHIVPTGLEAIDICRNRPYQAILMGLTLRRKDGLRASREIRRISAHTARVPIIAVAGTASEYGLDNYLEAGMTDVVKMPVNAINLHDVLGRHLNLAEDFPACRSREELLKAEDGDGEELGVVNWQIARIYSSILKKDFLPLLEEFLAAGPDTLNTIGAAIRKGDAEQVRFLAHKLKSTSLVFGAESVSNLSAQLEIIGKSGALQGVNALFVELHVQFEKARAALKKRAVVLRLSA